MDAKYLVVDDHAQSKEIEHVGEIVPDICIAVFACTLRVKSIGLRNTSRLMIAADEMNTMGVS